MNIKENIKQGKKSNLAAKLTAYLTAFSLIFAALIPENEASKYILANIEIIVLSAVGVVTILTTLISK